MKTFGDKTYSSFLKTRSDLGLTQEFTQDGLNYTLTFSADPVASNVITGYIGNQQVQVTYATSAANTYNLLAAAIGAVAGVLSVTVDAGNRKLTIKPINQSAGISVVGFVVTLGGSQPTIAIAVVDNRIKPGMPVMLLASGKIAPLDPTAADLNNIGTALDFGSREMPDGNSAIEPEIVTILLRGYAIMNAQAGIAAVDIGPVSYHSYDSVKKQVKVTDNAVTVANQYGWAIDAGANVGDAIRVIVKH